MEGMNLHVGEKRTPGTLRIKTRVLMDNYIRFRTNHSNPDPIVSDRIPHTMSSDNRLLFIYIPTTRVYSAHL